MIDKELNKKSNKLAINGVYRPFTPYSVLFASGEDAVEFVQGQVTQDISNLKQGEMAYAFLLTQKGRVVGDLYVIQESAESVILVSWSMTPVEMVDRLEAYIIADDVELVDETADWAGWQVAGSAAVTWGQEWVKKMGSNVIGWREPVPLGSGSFCLLTKEDPAWPEHIREGLAEDFERARLEAGVPRVPVDLGPTDFPQEAGQEKVGVSFTKGCYLGQEVMARLETTGRIRRRLFRVSGVGKAPEEGLAELKQGERVVGELRSRISGGVDEWQGLAMLNVAHLDTAREVELGEGLVVRVAEAISD